MQFAQLKRREFVTLLGSMAALALTWSFAALSQQQPVVGILHSASQAPFERYLTNFRKGLGEAGYVEGQNVSIVQRWADGHYDRLPELAADLVQRRVNVIAVPGNTMTALAAKAASGTIPIVFGIPDDPVKIGLVASLAHPGGNVTGINFFTAELIAKRMGLLHELEPRAVRVALLVNPDDVTVTEATVSDAQAAARGLGLQIQVIKASTADEIDAAFEAMMSQRPDGLFVAPGGFFNSRRVQLAILAARAAIPASYAARDYAEAGGLMSYGTNIGDMFRQVGVYAGRVLKGEKPADLPVSQPTTFEFVINLRTANALGLQVPPTLLARADEVIE
jgi:putative ABC transport system substrate-binding protein